MSTWAGLVTAAPPAAKPCKHGHTSGRFPSGRCIDCHREARERYHNGPRRDAILAKMRDYTKQWKKRRAERDVVATVYMPP